MHFYPWFININNSKLLCKNAMWREDLLYVALFTSVQNLHGTKVHGQDKICMMEQKK